MFNDYYISDTKCVTSIWINIVNKGIGHNLSLHLLSRYSYENESNCGHLQSITYQ
jgi:hypothetical protein